MKRYRARRPERAICSRNGGVPLRGSGVECSPEEEDRFEPAPIRNRPLPLTLGKTGAAKGEIPNMLNFKTVIVGTLALTAVTTGAADVQAMPIQPLATATTPAANTVEEIYWRGGWRGGWRGYGWGPRFGYGWRRPYWGYGWRRPFYGYGYGWRRPFYGYGWRRW
jgi:hypothetical protein